MSEGFLKDYEPVEDRLQSFWSEHPAGRIETELLHHADGEYIVRASVWLERNAFDPGPDATGLAHDAVAELQTNMKRSALEVCETSAIGRALANLGYAAKGKRPSREEMQKSQTVEPGSTVTGSPEASGMAGRDEAGSGEGEALGSASTPDEEDQRKDFRAYLAQRYGTDQALLMARQLFQTQARKVPNMTKLSLDELQAIDVEFKSREAAVNA